MKRCLLSLFAVGWLGLAPCAWGDSPGPVPSPWAAYPPSCLAYPLPASSGPTWTLRAAVETDGTTDHHETVTFVFWRTPCKGEKSALLGRVSRDAGNVDKQPAPLFTGFVISQGPTANHPARVATEPNTVLSYVPSQFSVQDGLTFVFENDAAASIDYSQAIDVTVNGDERSYSVSIPAYDEHQYPTADLALPLSGYVTGNWYDPAHGGEGAQVEIGAGSGNGRYIIFAWYTYASNGAPFWLFGQGAFSAGDRAADVTVAYATGGGFAGGPQPVTANWGTVHVEFPDCNSMHFTYQAAGGLPAGVPAGAGSRDWTRLTSINGLGCE